MGQAQREAIEAPGYVAVARVPTIQVRDPLVGPFPEKKNSFLTRLIDVAGALALLIFTAPLILFLALLVKLYDGGPVFFVHRRIGQGGNMFPCLKIRSMVMDADKRLDQLLASDANARAEWALDQKLRNDPRITGLGHFLRRSSLDELPQLINVLRGDMSLVGPRPIVLDEAPRYGRWLKYYCAVRPGITGMWQVSGRNNLTYRRRVACDVLYARRQSARMNLAILIMTIPAVLSQDGSH
jgi:lipopolysaccharide/colanic/teichoic acid biosynthesis glycosyltransferase